MHVSSKWGFFHHRPPTSSKNNQDSFLFQSFKYLFDHFSCRDNSCLRLLAWARCAFGNVSSKSDLYFISMPVCFKCLKYKCQSSLLLLMSNITFQNRNHMHVFTTCISCKFGHRVAPLPLPHCLGLPFGSISCY